MTTEQQILAELKATRMEIDNLKQIMKSMAGDQPPHSQDAVANYMELIKKSHNQKRKNGKFN